MFIAAASAAAAESGSAEAEGKEEELLDDASSPLARETPATVDKEEGEDERDVRNLSAEPHDASIKLTAD